MIFDFELLLSLLVLISGLIYLLDVAALSGRRQRAGITKMPVWIEYARSFFPILLAVLVLRSFIVEPFRIPSGSDKPTLLVGDFIVVNKFIYGLRLPVVHTKIWANQEPKIGDMVVFRYPVNPSIDLIKRVVGVPGDHISYVNKTLYINGQIAPQQFVGNAIDEGDSGDSWQVTVEAEDLLGIKHEIYQRPDVPAQDFSVDVPAGEYFTMGDNRDNSNDSRYWGFVPEANFVGKAQAIWFSWNNDQHNVRWSRMGTLIH